MIHFVALYKVSKKVTEEDLEEMIRISRTCFHRLNEVHNFRSGRNVDEEADHAFFISADFESREKLEMFTEDPQFHRFLTEVVEPFTTSSIQYAFETEPGRDPKYS